MMMQRGPVSYILLALFVTLLTFLHSSNSLPFYPSVYQNSRHKDYLVEIEDPDQVLDMLARLGQSIIRAQHEGSNAKRGLDLGLGRGFSGSQAAKHLMGLAAANFAAGPGKKKRGDLLMDLAGGSTYGRQQDLTSPVIASDSNEWAGGNKE